MLRKLFHAGSRMSRAAADIIVMKPACRLRFEVLDDRSLPSAVDPILHWNAIALDAVKADYDPDQTPEQGGPTRDSRALAIVHAAMFDAINSVVGHCTPYLTVAPNAHGASRDVAVAWAARDTLAHLYPSQQATFDAALTDVLAGIPDGPPEDRGTAVGRYVAAAILAARAGDGADAIPDYQPKDEPGHHQEDPLHPGQGYLGAHWGKVTPFALPDVESFRSPPPPAMTSPEYTAAFIEVAALGGDGINTSTERTLEQTQIGIFWGYDGSPGLGTPPRLYNQIARVVAEQEHNSVIENARLFALMNLALADAGIQSWDVKYAYDFWRPVVAIRAAQTDGNADTDPISEWAPLGAPRSNDPNGTNFTPPFPAYTSGHATFGAAAFRTLAQFYGRDDITFSFTSDEFNGLTRDQDGSIRPVLTRTFHSFTEAAEENGQSRIYLGVHWSFDKVLGIEAGNAIADFVFANLLRPRGYHGGTHHLSAVGDSAPASPSLAGDVADDSDAGAVTATIWFAPESGDSGQFTVRESIDEGRINAPAVPMADHSLGRDHRPKGAGPLETHGTDGFGLLDGSIFDAIAVGG